MKMFCKLFQLFVFFTLVGCGYRAGVGDCQIHGSKICVPYVKGDRKGLLTSQLIYSLKKSGLFSDSAKSALTLNVKICKDLDQEIGFREDFKNKDNEHRVVVDEKRKLIIVEASLCKCDQIVWGPKKIRAFVDYDFVDPDSLNDLSFIIDGKREQTLGFSLGQLTPQDSSLDSAIIPLYQRLAQKIVDQISLEW